MGGDSNPRDCIKGSDEPQLPLNGHCLLLRVIFVDLICYDVTVALWLRFTKEMTAPTGG